MSSLGRHFCFFAVLLLISILGLITATVLLYIFIHNLGSGYFDIEFIFPAAIMYPAFTLLIIFSWRRYRLEQSREKIVGIARGYDRITFDEMSKISGKPVSVVSDIIYSAISTGALAGTIQRDTFIRAAPTKGTVAVEREVMVTRRVPERCYKCNADINPKDVEWVGPDSVRCPHCGASLSVKTERI